MVKQAISAHRPYTPFNIGSAFREEHSTNKLLDYSIQYILPVPVRINQVHSCLYVTVHHAQFRTAAVVGVVSLVHPMRHSLRVLDEQNKLPIN